MSVTVNPETLRRADEIGANGLTHLLGQTLEELTGKIEIYRPARRAAGHPGRGTVSLMLHTFVGNCEDQVLDHSLQRHFHSSGLPGPPGPVSA